MIVAIIIACEIGFWALIAAGLAARYLLRWRRTSTVLLSATPLVDVALLVAVVMDLQTGGEASFFHGLAALYLGFSVAYGHAMITSADRWFAHRFADGLAPVKKYGADYALACWIDLARTGLAAVIAAGTLWLLIALAGDPARTAELEGLFPLIGVVLVIEIIWATSYSIWPKRAPTVAGSH